MKRRRFLAAGGAAGLAATAGCLGVFADYGRDVPSTVSEPPDGVYRPTYVAGRNVVGTADAGGLRVGLAYTIPHRYWSVSGATTTFHEPEGSAEAHLEVVLFDGDGRVVPVSPGTDIVVKLDVGAVDTATLQPVLSPHHGFYLGSNSSMPSQGSFTAEVTVDAASLPRYGDWSGVLSEQVTASIPLTWEPSDIQLVRYEELEDAGSAGAPPLLDDELPVARAPAPDALPGEAVGEATVDDAVLVVRAVPDGSRFVEGDGTYLYVSPRSRYNRVPLPSLSLSGTLSTATGGSTALDFAAAVDHAAGYHLGATVDGVSSGDEVELVVEDPPQVRRHEGYETAFLQMDRTTVTAP